RRDVHNRRAGGLDAATIPDLPEPLTRLLRPFRDAVRGLELAAAEEGAAIDRDLLAGRRAPLRSLEEPLVLAAIALQSRALASKLGGLSAKDPATWGHGDRHVAAKALAYVARFASKTSPNSIFCATALATASGETCSISGLPAIDRVDPLL